VNEIILVGKADDKDMNYLSTINRFKNIQTVEDTRSLWLAFYR